MCSFRCYEDLTTYGEDGESPFRTPFVTNTDVYLDRNCPACSPKQWQQSGVPLDISVILDLGSDSRHHLLATYVLAATSDVAHFLATG